MNLEKYNEYTAEQLFNSMHYKKVKNTNDNIIVYEFTDGLSKYKIEFISLVFPRIKFTTTYNDVEEEVQVPFELFVCICKQIDELNWKAYKNFPEIDK